MAEHVSGIRGEFFEYLQENYIEKNRGSLVYRFTWKESAVELLKKLKKKYPAYFPDLSTKALREGREEKDFRERLNAAMKSCTGERFRSELEQEIGELRQECIALQEERRERQRERKLPKELQKERQGERRKKRPTKRRDLWQQLWINYTAFRAGKITGEDYALWLVEYLAVRKKCYLDRCPSERDGNALLDELSRLAAIGLRGKERVPGLRRSEGETGKGKIRKALLGDYLEQLSQEMRAEKAAGKNQIVDRLREAGCLGRLWKLLERAAMHAKIKNWFQDSGFPLRMDEEQKEQKGDRKQDFTMRLFEDYYDGERGYRLGSWILKDNGICVMEDKQVHALERVLKQRKLDDFYIPLGVHLYSGCVLFIAGSAVYRDLYSRNSELRKRFEKVKKGRYCFDYLRLDEENFGAVGGGFRILPVFHENVGKDFDDVLADFKRYCVDGVYSAHEMIRGSNGDYPAGTPKAFRWAFYGPEEDDYKPSPEAEAAISKDREDWELTQNGRLQ